MQRPVERGETEQEIPEKNNKQKKKVGNQVYTKYERVLFFRLALCDDKLEENCEKDFSSETTKKKGETVAVWRWWRLRVLLRTR